MKVEEEVAIIYCGVNNLMRNIPINRIAEFEKTFISNLNYDHADVLSRIKQGQLDDEIISVLKKVANDVCNIIIKKA